MATFLHFAEVEDNGPLLASAVVPMLRNKDPKVISLVRMVQAKAESNSHDFDFHVYQTYLFLNSQTLSDSGIALVQYMMERSPNQALSVCALAFGPKLGKEKRDAILISARSLDDFLWRKKYGMKNDPQSIALLHSELRNLLLTNEWWAALGVAEFLSQYPELQTPDLTNVLGEDKNEYVRAAVTKWNKK